MGRKGKKKQTPQGEGSSGASAPSSGLQNPPPTSQNLSPATEPRERQREGATGDLGLSTADGRGQAPTRQRQQGYQQSRDSQSFSQIEPSHGQTVRPQQQSRDDSKKPDDYQQRQGPSGQQNKPSYQSDWRPAQGRGPQGERGGGRQYQQRRDGDFSGPQGERSGSKQYQQRRDADFSGPQKKPQRFGGDQGFKTSEYQGSMQQQGWKKGSFDKYEEQRSFKGKGDDRSSYRNQQQWGRGSQHQGSRSADSKSQYQGTQHDKRGDRREQPVGDSRSGEKNIGSKSENVWQKKQVQQARQSERAPAEVQSASSSVTAPFSQMKIAESPTDLPELPELIVCNKPGTLYRKKIIVQSNHFALDLGNLKEAFQYDVSIEELQKDKGKVPEKSTDKKGDKVGRTRKIKDKVQYRVMNAFLDKYFKGRYPSFDGQKCLYASRPLVEDLNQVMIDTGIVVQNDLGVEKTFKIEIQYVKTLSLIPQEKVPNTPAVLLQDAIQCIDIVLRNAPMYCFSQVGKSFFRQQRNRIIDLGGGMEMYYGFYQSVVTGGRPLLNVHLVHKAFPKNIKVLDAFLEILDSKTRDTRHTYEDLTRLAGWQMKELNAYIKGLKVSYQVPGFSRVIYRVNELALTPNRERLESGATVMDYFRTEKRYEIRYPDIPLLWVGSINRHIKIPAELCVIEKDQAVKRSMDDFQTSNMIRKSATDTKEHRNNTIAHLKEANYNESPFVKEFEFSVNDKFETTEARILPTPELQYSNGTEKVFKGVWRNKIFLQPKTVTKWAIVNIDQRVRRDQLERLMTELCNASKLCGLTFEVKPDFLQVNTRSRKGPTKTDLDVFFKDKKACNYDILFVVLPAYEGDKIYSNVKHAAEIVAGCLTQCIQAKTLNRMNMSTAINILLKVNGKLDGINHTFTPRTKPKLLQEEPVMLLGADVTHPGRNTAKPSVVAIIASHDPKAFQYNMTIRLQDPNVEYIEDLQRIVKDQLLFFFRKNNGAKPHSIIYFRDGVSEGQFSQVLKIELTAIKNACKEVQESGYDPKIVFLVVQKRHHTRLFPLKDGDSEDQGTDRSRGNYNVPAGTCVDTNIVDPTRQNFYLVSHASIKGVSRPTKYCTLYDDIGLHNDEIEELTYYLCHMFARCNRSVSYPAPTYYAHLGALRGNAYIKHALDENTFNIENLRAEMGKIQTQKSILENNPMFFI